MMITDAKITPLEYKTLKYSLLSSEKLDNSEMYKDIKFRLTYKGVANNGVDNRKNKVENDVPKTM